MRSPGPHFQVMLDTADHTELSDYLRLMRFNTSDPFASAPVGAIEKRPLSLTPRSSESNQAALSCWVLYTLLPMTFPSGTSPPPCTHKHTQAD